MNTVEAKEQNAKNVQLKQTECGTERPRIQPAIYSIQREDKIHLKNVCTASPLRALTLDQDRLFHLALDYVHSIPRRTQKIPLRANASI